MFLLFMFIEVLIFSVLGIGLGIFFGLAPGLHPNLIVLMLPLFIATNIAALPLLAFITALAISNSIIDFIPSILLGAPDSGNELSILPGHKMLMKGMGYEAIKLTVIGGVGSIIFCVLLFSLIVFIIPALYATAQPYIYLLLIFIVLIMVMTEKGKGKKLLALFCFLLAGFIGMLSSELPIDNTLILFPILSGLFGISFLLLQIKKKVSLPAQGRKELFVSRGLINRGVVFGSLGGVFSGLLPGVGSSEVATLVSVDKNDHSFLVTVGALTTANIIMSILSLWLIGKSRSGAAVVIEQLMTVGLNEVLIILSVGLVACGVAALITLYLAKKFTAIIKRVNYSSISIAVIAILVVLIFIFSGWYGLFLAAICSCLGIAANLAGIKRGNLMGVLILPTILFYIGI